jgi:hypothetical protein
MRGLIRKSVIFSENIDDNHRSWFASPTPPAMMEFGCFGFLAEDRPIRLADRAFRLLFTLIESLGAVVGKDALLRLVARESRCVKARAGANTNARPSADMRPQLAIRR